MRKFYVSNQTFDTYIVAETMEVEDGILYFSTEGKISAAFASEKWDYFKEVPTEII